jgi:hypothetical protein
MIPKSVQRFSEKIMLERLPGDALLLRRIVARCVAGTVLRLQHKRLQNARG